LAPSWRSFAIKSAYNRFRSGLGSLGREGSALDIKKGDLPDGFFKKDWVVKDLKSHDSYTEKFYNAPEREFPRSTRSDILSLLASHVRCGDRRDTNADIESHLRKRE